MHSISVWDCTSIKYTTVVITTSGLSAAMLDLMVVGNPSSFALHVPASAMTDSTIIALKFIFCPKYSPIYGNFRFTAAILNFLLNGLSDSVGVSIIEKFDPENIGVAAGILFLSALELEIHLEGKFYPPWTLNVSILCWTPGGLKNK
jgi:hypothetical protein